MLRGKKTQESGVRKSGEKKYFYIDNGPRKRVVIFSGIAAVFPELGVGAESEVRPSTVRPLRVSVAMKTDEEEAEAVLAICGMVRAFGGPEVSIDLRVGLGGPPIDSSSYLAEYGTMGLDNFDKEGFGFE